MMCPNMIAPRCLIDTHQSGFLFQADFVGSGKWFRRIFRFTQPEAVRRLGSTGNTLKPANPGLTSGLPRPGKDPKRKPRLGGCGVFYYEARGVGNHDASRVGRRPPK